MPQKFTRKRMFKKKSKKVVSRRVYAKPSKFIPFGVPGKYFCKLRYADHITLDPNVSGLASYVFRANDLYDPDVTGTGHQPSPFDTMMSVYATATVVYSKMYIVPTMPFNDSTVPMYITIIKSHTSTVATELTDYIDLAECRNRASRLKLIGNYSTKAVDGNNILKANFSAKKWFRVKSIIGDRNYQCDAGSSPAESCFYQIISTTPDGTNPSAQTYRVNITFYAVFTEPKTIARS